MEVIDPLFIAMGIYNILTNACSYKLECSVMYMYIERESIYRYRYIYYHCELLKYRGVNVQNHQHALTSLV